MIKVQIIGDKELVAQLSTAIEKIRGSMIKSISRLTLELTKHVKEDKLSGQVLNVRTGGRLRRSIHNTIQSDPEQVVGKVGTDVVYAAFHEYGFHGTESVRAYTRRTLTQMKDARRMNPAKYISKRQGEIQVKAHTRQVNYPEHSFLRSALKDMEPYIKQQLVEAANGSVRESIKK